MDKQLVAKIVNEETAYLTVVVLNAEFPNVEFEGVENGCGQYDVSVVSKYQNEIHPRTLKMFQNKLYEVTRTISVVLLHQKQVMK